MAKAVAGKLAPGEHTAESAIPRKRQQGGYRVSWTLVYRDGRKVRKNTFAPTKGEARRRAKETAEEELATNGGAWQLSDPLSKYIAEVAEPAIAKAKLGEYSQERYAGGLRFLLGDCRTCKRAHRVHEHGFRRHTIGSGTSPRALEATFTEIAQLHGLSTAKSCRTVWNKYIAKHLIFDGLIKSNPVLGIRLTDLTGVERPERTRGGRALTRDEYERTLNWLLAADASSWPISHKKGGWIWEPEVQVATYQSAIDIALLQMTTGLRQSEARFVDWSMAHVGKDGVMHIDVPKHVAKAGHPRVVLVLDQRVAEHLQARREVQEGAGYIVGAPMDTMKPWNRMRCGEATRKLYDRMAEALKIEIFETQRSHLWRTTLRSFYIGKVPEPVLNSQFGHSSEVANLYYTDASDLSGLAAAAELER